MLFSAVPVRGVLALYVCLANAALHASAAAPPVAAAAPGEWTMFRGNPALTGVAAGSVPGQPALLWNYKTGAAVKSSAVIGGGKVYIGSDDGQVYALDFASGKKVWAFKSGPAVLAPPLLADGTVLVGDSE
jgi:eukaryotic-like serine/threonine-protein kinase